MLEIKPMCKRQYFFLQIESTGSEVAFSDTRLRLGHVREDSGCLWKLSDIFVSSSKFRNLMPITQKSWQVYGGNPVMD